MVQPVANNQGVYGGWRATLRDVTDRRDLEVRLRHAHRVEEVGRWPAVLPMTLIIY